VTLSRINVAIIGGGPAGLSAAIAASEEGSSVLLVERETRLGGILKQCIHDGFGILRYGESLTGPEYASRDISTLNQTNTVVMLQTFVSKIERVGNAFQLTLCNRHGIVLVEADTVVLATGCRERSARQVPIHGMRSAGVLTAGSAQYYVNILGQLPVKNCLILGSEDIGMIVARRLTLEGAKVLGVYEAQPAPAGSLRNVTQCLNDYDIPLHLSHTVTRTFGTNRLRAVEVCRVNKEMQPIRGSENIVKCDGLILSAGLIPENELAESLNVPLSETTHGPVCDQNNMTMVDGVYSCGNALYVSDLADHVSESGRIAGQSASRYMGNKRSLITISASKDFLSVVPNYIDFNLQRGETPLFFRASKIRKDVTVNVEVDSTEVFSQHYISLRPAEMERISIDFNPVLTSESKIRITMKGPALE